MVSPLKFGLLGHPVGHSVSPAIHQAAYDAFQLPHVYSLCDCPTADDVEAQVGELRAGRWAGLNVTVPWKRVALRLADAVDHSAAETGAANVLVREPSGRIVAHNTDAPALGRLLAAGTVPAPVQTGLVLGNGGAALAAVVAAKRAGCDRVYVSARRWLETMLPWDAASEFEKLGATPIAWGQSVLGVVAPDVTLVVQATSAGMRGVGGGDELVAALPWDKFPKSVFAYDVVYNPEVTPFLVRASELELRCEGGLSMLVGQAAFAIELWLGVSAPHAQLMKRARAAIFGRQEAES
jgi:shikimate dehydrogenase